MASENSKQLGYLTLATILISTSGALGKFIDLPTPVVIWLRCCLAALFLLIFIRIARLSLKINTQRDFIVFFLSAIFLGAHWITYFYALKFSNVAIGMLSLFTFPIITALLEPIFFKTKLDGIHVLLGIMVLVGIYILAPEFNLKNDYLIGIILGIISAFCYALRNLIIKERTKTYNGTILMFYQVSFLTILLLPTLILFETTEIKNQYPYVLILALVTTAIGHTLFIRSFKYFKVSTASIIGSSQPIFGIIIAYFFLNEIPTLNTFIGGAIILATVIIESIRSGKTA